MVLHGTRFTFLLVNHGENNALRVQDHCCHLQIWILCSATHRVVRYEGTSTATHHALTRRRPIAGVYTRACLLRCNRNTHFGVMRVPINVSNPTSVSRLKVRSSTTGICFHKYCKTRPKKSAFSIFNLFAQRGVLM